MNVYSVALLIPHYNQRPALEQSLRSVTFTENLRIVIVDDGSSEPHVLNRAWADSLSLPFPIHLIHLNANAGITAALNAGLTYIFSETSCAYVARLDCGDHNLNNRLNKQYRFMEEHPDIALVGSWCTIVNAEQRVLYTVKTPASHQAIQKKMLGGNCFVHPSVMFRVSAAREAGLYPDAYPAAEDYAYFFEFVKRFQTANLQEVLVQKERSDRSISYRNRRKQLVSRVRIIAANFRLQAESIKGLARALIFLLLPAHVVERVKEKMLS